MQYDAIIVGAGPNGLSAAIKLAQEGLKVAVFEASDIPGGGVRTMNLTLPGFSHDVCSAVHPLAAGSPYFKSLPLDKYGLEWIYPEVSIAHPFDNGTAAFLEKSIEKTSHSLLEDAQKYRKWMGFLLEKWDLLKNQLLGPLRVPEHPLAMAQFGIFALQPAHFLAKNLFKEYRARALFTGMAAHAIMDLDKVVTSAIGMVLAILGHVEGWPMPKGGAQNFTNALVSHLKSLGGELITGQKIDSIKDLPQTRSILFDITPEQLLKIAGSYFPISYQKKLTNYRYGPGVFKLDWALDEPIPFKAKICDKAGTIHIGGTMDEIVESEKIVWKGRISEKPFVLLVQPSRFDPSRAPEGKHTAWAYCHVPNGSTFDMTTIIENQIERFAPGFKDIIIKRHKMNTSDFQSYNANYVGGDINGGVQDIKQLFTRPVRKWIPYATAREGIYICSSSTPPGGGVHGMCGYHAADAALSYLKV
jgi:phytoene dehydrogenase-like protein